MAGSMHGRTDMHDKGTCVMGQGGHVWQGGAWQGGFVCKGSVCSGAHSWQGGMHGETTNAADSMHPTGMHSHFLNLTNFEKLSVYTIYVTFPRKLRRLFSENN